jgi:hypothetical protein
MKMPEGWLPVIKQTGKMCTCPQQADIFVCIVQDDVITE